jgi:hypothetical protein
MLLLTMNLTNDRRPLVREGAPQGQNSNYQTLTNIWSGLDTKTISRKVTLTLSRVVLHVPFSFTLKMKLRFCPHVLFRSFLRLTQSTPIISLGSINWQVFVIYMRRIFCEVEIELYIKYNLAATVISRWYPRQKLVLCAFRAAVKAPLGFWDVEAPTFCPDSRLADGGKLVSP